MFTGIIQTICQAAEVKTEPGYVRYAVTVNPDSLLGLHVGASIAVDGVCQTVIEFNQTKIWFDAIEETLKRTTLKFLKIGQNLNFERAACIGNEVGGHFLSGHIFGTVVIKKIERFSHYNIVTCLCPAEWTKYLFSKGFIALNGISLTLVDVDCSKGLFTVHLIPETLKRTTFGNKKEGDLVNLEFDYQTQTIVETVERVLSRRSIAKKKSIDLFRN